MTAEQFVVFLDILGFKERVFRNSHAAIEKDLRELNEEIIQLVNSSMEDAMDESRVVVVNDAEGGQEQRNLRKEADSPIQLAQFSDSIVLFSNDVSTTSLNRIATVASKIMNASMSKGFPLKGALAQGTMTNDPQKQLFFGRALIDAYLFEEELHYYGIAVHHSAEGIVVSNGDNNIFKDNNLFLKSGRIRHYEVCWYQDNDAIKEYLNRIRTTVSGQPRKYIDNTLTLIKEVSRPSGLRA